MKKKTTEQKMLKLKEQLLSEDVVLALETFTKNMKVVSRAYSKLKQITAMSEGDVITLGRISADLGIKLENTVVFDLSLHPMLIPDSIQKLKKLKTIEEVYKNYHIIENTYNQSESIRFHKNATGIISQAGELVCPSILSLKLSTGNQVIIAPKNYKPKALDITLSIICDRSLSKEAISEIKEIIEVESPLKGSLLCVSKFDGIKILNHKTKFDVDAIPMEEALRKECAAIEKLIKSYNNNGDTPFRRNILISGIPGIGKTTIANGIIKTALSNKCTAIMVDEKDAIAAAWGIAEELAPSLLVLEDFDLMAGDRFRTQQSTVSSSLLNLMDGAKEAKGVLTLATTNRIGDIDVAAIRAGRINRHYNMAYPTTEIKDKILECHLEHYKINRETITEVMGGITNFIHDDKMTGAVIDSLVLAIKQCENGNKKINNKEMQWILDGLVHDNEASTDTIL